MRARAFTLVEMLVVLAIVAILLALGTPSLARLRALHTVGAAANQTLAGLHLARRLALTRGQTITVCPSRDGTTCQFGGREWLMFANLPGGLESRREPAEELLRRWPLAMSLQVDGTRGYAAFQPRPGAAATVTFRFWHQAWPSFQRELIVSQTGRPRLVR